VLQAWEIEFEKLVTRQNSIRESCRALEHLRLIGGWRHYRFVDVKPRTLINYVTDKRDEPFQRWISGLKNLRAHATIRSRIKRVAAGNFGECRPVGNGVQELVINFGPGYRVYFGEDADLVVILCGGDKSTQRADLMRANRFWSDYNA
jgi:putative addiction module killer protein